MAIFEVTLKDGDIVRINGIGFVKMGNNLIKVINKEGVTSEETRHPDGRVDCKVHIPCLDLSGETKPI